MSNDLPSRPKLRKELEETLRVDPAFDAFCIDYFPDVYRRFAGGMDRVQKANLLLSTCDLAKVSSALAEWRATRADHDSSSPAPFDPLSLDERPPWPWFKRQWHGMLPPARQSIREFLDVYLGTQRQPSPFGGRTADKRRLLEWLATPDAPPYHVLRALTGRGKSALISRVVIAAGEQQDLDVVFVPISMRFRLARLGSVLHALLGQLAGLSGAKSVLPIAMEDTKALLHEQLRRPATPGRRRLIIIDGLDEIIDWQFESGLFPQEPSATKVLLSFRKLEEDDGVQWQRQLGLGPRLVEESSLKPLGRTDVLEALRSAELPQFDPPREALLAERLFKLSQGDPLVLGLLLDECQGANGLSQLLDGQGVDLQVGLRGCWDRMLKPAEQDALSPSGITPTWQLMALLSCAYAPLQREDVIALAELGSGEALDRALQPVQRWVLHTSAGYVFNHPGLREFVHDKKLGPAEQKKWHGRFAHWGDRVLAEMSSGACAPSAVPRYLLEWLSTHLGHAAAAPEAFLRLLSKGWKRAWEHEPLGYSGLLQDIERAMHNVEAACHMALEAQHRQTATPYLPELLRCALWRSSIHSYTGNLELSLLIPLVEHALLTPKQALVHLQRRFLTEASDTHRSFDDGPALRETMRFLYAHQPDELVELAVTMADGDAHWNRHEVLLDLLPALTQKGEPAALILVRNLRSLWLKIRALLTVCSALPTSTSTSRLQLQDEACELIKLLPRPHAFLNMLPWALPQLSADHQEELRTLALVEARGIPEPSVKGRRLLELLKLLSESDLQQGIFLEAVDAALKSDESYDIDLCLEKLTQVRIDTVKTAFQRLIAQGRDDAVVRWLLKDEGSISERSKQLGEYLQAAECAQLRQAAIRAAAVAWDESWNVDQLRRLIEIGAADDALAIVRNTKDARKKREGLVRLIDLLPQSEQLEVLEAALSKRSGYEAKDLVGRLLSLDSLPLETVRKSLLYTIDAMARATGLIHLLSRADEAERKDLIAELERVEQIITDPKEQIELLELLFDFSPTEELLDELLKNAAAETARTRSAREESTVLGRLARWLNEPYRSRVLQRLVDLIEQEPAHIRAMELMSLLRLHKLPPEISKRVLRRSKSIARGAQVTKLLRYLDSAEERGELLSNELARSQNIDDERARIVSAAALASSEALCQKLISDAKVVAALEGRFLVLAELGRCLPFLREVARSEALIAASPIIDSPRTAARSYLLHHGSPEQVHAVVENRHLRIRVLVQDLEPILKRWRGLSDDEKTTAYDDLKSDKQNSLSELRDLVSSIGKHLDEKAAEQLLEELSWLWIDVAAALLPALSPTRKATVFSELQERAHVLPERERTGVLAQLAEHLPERQRSTAISDILAYPNQALHSHVIWLLAPLLDTDHLPRIVEAIAFASQSFLTNIVAIVERVPAFLRQDLVNGLYEKLRAPETPQNNSLLIQLAQYLAGEALADAMSRTAKTTYPKGMAALAQAVKQMDIKALGAAFKLLRTASGNVHSGPHDPMLVAVSAVAEELARRAPEYRFAMFDYVQHTLDERGAKRSLFLDALSGLAPLLKALGPPAVGDLLAQEVLAIGSVWP